MPTPVLDVIIPYAACHAPACTQAAASLQLPHLDQLLSRWFLTEQFSGAPTSLSPPHERALAISLGLIKGLPQDDGHIPWASWSMQTAMPTPTHAPDTAQNAPAAWLTPCHWHIGADHVRMGDPDALGLTEASSRALLDILAPWFAEDGISLYYHQPTLWLASGAPLAELATASLDRVVQRDVRPWLPTRASANAGNAANPAHPTALMLQRLQSEMQMLLYTHPFTEAREAERLPTVNAFWLHGAGVWVGASQPTTGTNTQPALHNNLRAAALQEDWQSWCAAWAALDAGPIAQLLGLPDHTPARLTLCGESGSQQWSNTPPTTLTWPEKIQRQFKQFFKPYRSSLLISSLCK